MELLTLYNLCVLLNYIRLFRPYFDKKSTRGNSFFHFPHLLRSKIRKATRTTHKKYPKKKRNTCMHHDLPCFMTSLRISLLVSNEGRRRKGKFYLPSTHNVHAIPFPFPFHLVVVFSSLCVFLIFSGCPNKILVCANNQHLRKLF